MSDAKLSVLLQARDEASAVLRGVGNELGVLDQKAASHGAGFAKMGESIAGVAKVAAGFALGGLALHLGGDLAGQFKEVLGDTVDLGRATRRLQLDVGGTAEEVSGLLAVFHRFGMEGADAERTLSLFSKKLRGDFSASDAAESNPGVFAGVVKELGIEATDATGHLRPMNELLLETADGFKQHVNDGQNAARAQTLFGKSGKDLVPILVLGRDGIMELEVEARKLGLTLTQDNVTSVRQFIKGQKDMGESVEGLKLQLGTALMPMFVELAIATAEWAKSLNADGGKGIKDFASGVRDVAGAFGDLKKAWDNVPALLKTTAAMSARQEAEQAKKSLGSGVPVDVNIPGQGKVTLPGTGGKGRVYVPGQGWMDVPAAELFANTLPSGFANEQQFAINQARGASMKLPEDDTAALTLAREKKAIDDAIAAGERANAIVQHDIALKTRESLDMKRTEAQLQLQMLPLKEQQASIEQQLVIAADKRASLERDAAVTRAQMAANASADALEGADFEERRLKAKIRADALGGRGVQGGDVASLQSLAMNRPQLELDALLGGRGATLAEKDRQRAQQAQDLATLPLRARAAEIDQSMASLSAQSAAVQRQIEEARLHGTVDTTDLQKQKQALDDALFAKNQQKADLEGKGVVLNITQQITSSGEVDYDKVVSMTYQGVLAGLTQAQRTVGAPAPTGLPGSRGVTGPS